MPDCGHKQRFETKAAALGHLLAMARTGVRTMELDVHLCLKCVSWVISKSK